MPENRETGTSEFADRIQHFENVAKGIDSIRHASEAAAASIEIMCNFCKGAGGWGCGKDAEACPECKGTGTVAVPEHAKPGADCEVCAGTGSSYGKRCEHSEAQS